MVSNKYKKQILKKVSNVKELFMIEEGEKNNLANNIIHCQKSSKKETKWTARVFQLLL